jgi:hypothetical protein
MSDDAKLSTIGVEKNFAMLENVSNFAPAFSGE